MWRQESVVRRRAVCAVMGVSVVTADFDLLSSGGLFIEVALHSPHYCIKLGTLRSFFILLHFGKKTQCVIQ